MNESDLKSPPRPQRMVNLTPRMTGNRKRESKNTDPEGDERTLMQFEEGLVDRAVSDLPNIASQVFSLNKDQNKEIKRQRDLLTAAQERVKKDEEEISEVELEIKCVMNKIFMKEEETKDTNKRIKDTDAEIKSMITEVCNQELEVQRTKDGANQETRQLETKLQKVQGYGDNVERFEQSTSQVYIELQKVKQEVEELRKQQTIIDKDPEETERLLSGAIEKEIQSDINALKTKPLQAGSEAKLNITKLTEERQKHKQLNQTIQVLHKRNTAQLTRLKRQVKEIQTRNRQKQAQLTQLKTNMVTAENQLAK